MTPAERSRLERQAVWAASPTTQRALQRAAEAVGPVTRDFIDDLNRLSAATAKAMRRGVDSVPPGTWETLAAVVTSLIEAQRRVRDGEAADLSAAVRQLAAQNWVAVRAATASGTAVVPAATIKLSVHDSVSLTESSHVELDVAAPPGSSPDWRSDWWLTPAVALFVQWMILRVAAEAEFEDTGLMDSLESSISTALAIAGAIYAWSRRSK